MGAFVGIDLGTTYSVVACINSDDKPQAIPTAYNRTTVPSVVYFGSGAPLVGEDAKQEQAAGNESVASFFKRNMGDPYFVLSFNGRDYTPVDLSALVLAHLKKQAEDYLKMPVTDAVITVPAYFDNARREATKQAGEQAGLRVLSIINEPTAAAIAYGMRPSQETQNVLVYDLGGGTFDVSLVAITPHELRVLATDGDHSLGGRDWDDRLLIQLQHQFQAEFGADLVGDDFNRLLVQAEEAKRTLSDRQSVPVRVTASGHTATYTITREQFENLSQDLLERTAQLTESVLQQAHLGWRDIANVVPVGGSTRMPMVRAWVERMSGKPPMGGVHPDEAVALGAAIQAAFEIEREQSQRLGGGAPKPVAKELLRDRRIQDVTAHTLGLIAESEDGSRYINSRLIVKNSPIPAEQGRPYAMRLRPDGTTELEVFVTQGESDDPQACTYLGLYSFTDFPALNAPEAQVDVKYGYDSSTIVQVEAVEHSTGKPLKLEVKPVPPDVPARFLRSPRDQRGRGGEPMTVYIAIDVSGSMCGEPLAQAQQAAHEFVRQLDMKTTAIGLIAVSDAVHIDQQATHSQSEIERAIDRMTCCSTGGGNSGHPFDTIYDLLSPLSGPRFAIVLADGVWSYQDRAIQQAKRCHHAEINVIAVGFGSADQQFLRAIASTEAGAIYTTQGGLGNTFSTIARELSGGSDGKTGGKLGRYS